MKTEKKMRWYGLALMCFSTLWGFGNVVNGFVYFNGTQVIFSWVLMFALYFVPYALMVGELGSAFKDSDGGVTSWIAETSGKKLAYYAGWTYFVVHITYIVSKSSNGLKALSWAIFQSADQYAQTPVYIIQTASLILVLLFCFIASRGVSPIKKLAGVAGTSMFVMSLLFIIMMFAAPAINPNVGNVSFEFSKEALLPQFNLNYFSSLSILVFAVGGAEKISPYVNKVKNASKEFPRGMVAVSVMVIVCAVLGTVALGMMFDPAKISADSETFNMYVSNGAYWAFEALGEYYGAGKLFVIVYSVCNAIGLFSTLAISIDAPLRMLLGDPATKDFLPKKLMRQNKNGAYINGIRLVAVLAGAIILMQLFVPGGDDIITQLTKLNSVCMPMRYLWVFVAYILLRRKKNNFPREYVFIKNDGLAKTVGVWCFAVTALCCITGMYSEDTFTMIMNICTPVVLCLLGLIMPMIRVAENKRERKRANV